MKTSFWITLLCVSSASVFRVDACSCEVLSSEQSFALADVVFSGTVAAIVEDAATHHVFIDLLEVWKGELALGGLVRVDTPNNSAACGILFQVGEEGVIFAFGGSDTLSANSCVPNAPLSRAKATELFGPPLAVNPLSVEFQRGDVNGDGGIDIADPINSLSFQFQGGFDPPCLEALDFDDDGEVDIGDAIGSLQYQFQGGPPPAEPFGSCGKDLLAVFPDTCERFPACPLKPDVNEIVRVEQVGGEVEIELSTTRPLIPRALIPILCIGTQDFNRLRHPEGRLDRMIFTLTPEEFDGLDDRSYVAIHHGDQCLLTFLDQMRLYWDLWIFGPLEGGSNTGW